MEIRVAAGYRCVQDVDCMIDMIRARMEKLPSDAKLVIAADWRGVAIMSPETATRARAMLAKVNPAVLRSAILTLSDQSISNLQVQRLIREAESAHRMHFTSADEMRAWLNELLLPPEANRLSEFLASAAGPPTR